MTKDELIKVMKSGEMYNSFLPELFREQWKMNDIAFEFNQTRPSDKKDGKSFYQNF